MPAACSATLSVLHEHKHKKQIAQAELKEYSSAEGVATSYPESIHVYICISFLMLTGASQVYVSRGCLAILAAAICYPYLQQFPEGPWQYSWVLSVTPTVP